VRTYFDTSALVAVYVSEAHSTVARREARAAGQIPWTPLHELELWNALRLLRGRRLIDDQQLEEVSSHVVEDCNTGRLIETPVDLHRVFERARELSVACTVRFLCRSLDILHVAAAFELECSRFISGDERQLGLAKELGSEIVDIGARRRRKRR
jgi:predicted nucleic acid-binding protein